MKQETKKALVEKLPKTLYEGDEMCKLICGVSVFTLPVCFYLQMSKLRVLKGIGTVGSIVSGLIVGTTLIDKSEENYKSLVAKTIYEFDEVSKEES